MMTVPLGSYASFALDTLPGDESDKGKTPGLDFMKLISTNTIFEEYWRKFMKTPYFFLLPLLALLLIWLRYLIIF
ncbi:hypothetical protein ES705_41812 [subsurface metagenome]